jgi:hypothetical protein
MRKLDNWNKNESRIVFAIVMTLFIMALFSTLGDSAQRVLWYGFGFMFLNVLSWSIADGRFRKK